MGNAFGDSWATKWKGHVPLIVVVERAAPPLWTRLTHMWGRNQGQKAYYTVFGHFLIIAAESTLDLVNNIWILPIIFYAWPLRMYHLSIFPISLQWSLLINIFKFGFCCFLLRTLTCTISIVISLRVHFSFFWASATIIMVLFWLFSVHQCQNTKFSLNRPAFTNYGFNKHVDSCHHHAS